MVEMSSEQIKKDALLGQVVQWRELAARAEGLLRDAEGIDNDVADQWFIDMWVAMEGTE
jgi:hypothetical protein